MSTPQNPPSSTGPDRLFARASAAILVVCLAMMLAGAAVVARALRHEAAATHAAVGLVDAAGSTRAVVAGLELFTTLPTRDVPRLARMRLTREAEALQAAAPALGPLGAGLAADAAQVLSIADGEGAGIRNTAALTRRHLAEMLPLLDRDADAARNAVLAASGKTRATLMAALAVQLVALLLLVGFVVLPVRDRIARWLARHDELDRENNFRLLHDALTGLPNDTYLHAYLARIAAGAARARTQTAVLRIDLDRFRILRATLGKRACDDIIRLAARRIEHALRAGDLAAYLGADDFAVVAGGLGDAQEAAPIAARIQAALEKPFAIRDGGARRITCGIGVTLVSDDAAEPDRILTNAGIALAAAQEAGAGSVRYFRESLREEVERRATLYTELLAALERGELIAHYQPQIDLATGAFGGFEVLCRWRHPRRGLLAPPFFLDFADETDLTERIGEVMVCQALEALQGWDSAGLTVPRVGVNFALAQLRDPRLIEKIKWETERHDIDPSRLAIEVLETVLIKSDADMVVRNLRGLVSAGFSIELDDFGTGHASISNLRRFMVDRIKIDKSFVFGIETSTEQQQLCASMIAMANALDIRTLAEGVESAEALAMLRSLGCDAAQGFHIARPMPLEETFAWLAGAKAAAAPAQPRPAGGGDEARSE